MEEWSDLLQQIKALKWTEKYSRYIELRKSGLKKNAQHHLVDFFSEFLLQDKNSRRNFIDIVCTLSFITNDYSIYLPNNMYHQLILPEINDWINNEPLNPIPYKWSNDMAFNKKSLELDPENQIAIENFASRLIGKISMNQHEIISGYPYDGNINEDITMIEFVERFIPKLNNSEKITNISRILSDLKKCAIKYQMSRN